MQICPQCSFQNSDTSRFCGQCGRSLPGAGTGRLSPQSVLAGRYVIVKLLGKGGMGAVYLASDGRIAGKSWAVKEMSDADLLDPAEKTAAMRAFQTEASLLATLDHPNIPKVVDYFDEAGRHYLVMDFVPGDTLEKLMQTRGAPFTEQQVAQWGAQLCDVLSYLHSRQPPVIFRDLKPGNVIVQPDGTLKLIDFGIARVFKPGRSADTTIIGTPGFAAPEQHGRAQTDARSDIYSLGVMLHHLATGHDPASDPFNLPPARRLNPQVSPRFEETVARATALTVTSRFQTAAAMRQVLIGAGGGVAPAQPTIVVAPPPGLQRRGGRLSLVILGVMALVALALSAVFLTRTPSEPPPTLVVMPPATPTLTSPGIVEITPDVESASPPATVTRMPDPAPTKAPTAPPTERPTLTPVPPTPTPNRSTPTPDIAAIKTEVETVLLQWSDIHKRAVRQVREDELSGILSGEALEKQLGSVRWLRDHNAYWDVTTFDRRTDAWEYVTPTWVRALVWRDEKGDYYQDGKYYPKSSYREQYQARFVLEQINGRWRITCKGSLESGKPEPCLLAPP